MGSEFEKFARQQILTHALLAKGKVTALPGAALGEDPLHALYHRGV